MALECLSGSVTVLVTLPGHVHVKVEAFFKSFQKAADHLKDLPPSWRTSCLHSLGLKRIYESGAANVRKQIFAACAPHWKHISALAVT